MFVKKRVTFIIIVVFAVVVGFIRLKPKNTKKRTFLTSNVKYHNEEKKHIQTHTGIEKQVESC